MSQENVEVVLEAFRRFAAGDLAGFREMVDPHITCTAPPDWPEPGPWQGADAYLAQMERIAADWTEMRITPHDVVSDQGDWVVVEYSWQTRGAKSGIETSFDLVGSFNVNNGLLAEAHYRWDRAEAFEAAGLSE